MEQIIVGTGYGRYPKVCDPLKVKNRENSRAMALAHLIHEAFNYVLEK